MFKNIYKDTNYLSVFAIFLIIKILFFNDVRNILFQKKKKPPKYIFGSIITLLFLDYLKRNASESFLTVLPPLASKWL